MYPSGLPGQDLVDAGFRDLERGVETPASLLVSIGAPRLRRLGFSIPTPFPDPERALYLLLAREDPDSAHSRYNALVRRLASFERGRGMRALADRERIGRFTEALGREARREVRVYWVGGTTAVLLGWCPTTSYIDLVIQPEDDDLLRAIVGLKESLQVNVELASPGDFIPVPEGWEERSRYLTTVGRVSFYHYDLYAQALAKVERGHRQDLADVEEMVARGLIEPAMAKEYFARIEPSLHRFPAIHGPSFRAAVERVFEPR